VGLLRVLEEKRFIRLGGSRSISSDFRLIAATHRDLLPLIRENQFREDFYYRINVITLHVPPLRERPEDIPALSDHFLKRYVEDTGKHLEGFTKKALFLLDSYTWPGNVRELKNVIERAVVISKGRMIGSEELKFLDPGRKNLGASRVTLEELEKSHITAMLASCKGNISEASRRLGINRSTLSRKMKRYAIEA